MSFKAEEENEEMIYIHGARDSAGSIQEGGRRGIVAPKVRKIRARRGTRLSQTTKKNF